MESDDAARMSQGFEYKSKLEIFGLPLVHVCFKYRHQPRSFWRSGFAPIPARGVIAIGQVAFGFVTLSQMGIGVFAFSQFAIGAFVIAQFAVAIAAIAQFGISIYRGWGEFMLNILDML